MGRIPSITRRACFSFFSLTLVLSNAISPGHADPGQNASGDDLEKPWQPPFVGGIHGPLLGIGWRGFLQIDGATFSNDVSGEFEDDVVVRRARLTFARKANIDWLLKGSAEINLNNIEIKDFYGRYEDLSFASLQIGNQKEPFSLQEMTGSRFTSLMERSLVVDALAPERNVGVTLHAKRNNMAGAIGAFIGGFQQDAIQVTGAGVTGRLTRHHTTKDRSIVHMGLSASYRALGTTPPQYRSRPESAIDDLFMIDTGEIERAHDLTRLGLEAAYVNGPLSLQGEYIATRVVRDTGLNSLFFDGWYVHASWFLTGESRPYLKDIGTFGRVIPSAPFTSENGGGAWELALRFSQADLSDEDVVGGKEKNLTFGLNWHLREYVILMANYIKVLDVDRPGSVFDNNDMDIYQMRLQLEF